MQQSVQRIDLRQYRTLTAAIISDTHGEIDDSVVGVVERSDIVLHAGDIMGAHVLDRLRPARGLVFAVRGNNDVSAVWHEDQRNRLAGIPDVVQLECSGGLIAMEHGHHLFNIEIDQLPLRYKYDQARMVVYGHTHVEKLDQGSQPWLLNPGVAGLVRNQGGAACYQLRIEGNEWSLESFKFPALRATA